MRKIFLIVVLAGLAVFLGCSSQGDVSSSGAISYVSVIPMPSDISMEAGTFKVSPEFCILVDSDAVEARNVAEYFASRLRRVSFFKVPVGDLDDAKDGKPALVLSLTVFAHVARLAQARGRDIVWAATTSYWVAAAVCLTWWALDRDTRFGPAQGVFGVMAGITVMCAFFLFTLSLRIAGVGIAQSVGRVSVIIPLGACVLVWGEAPDVLRWTGLALAILSLGLLTRGNGTANAPGRILRRLSGPVAELPHRVTSGNGMGWPPDHADCE